ncbi:site-specific integrase [Kibdelosporangium philippinense]|uniref:Site-specific integrase n=2 Tax=Kibdelosporangium philippinense TaxID=211113 RepID=A0ABS8ZIX3_9PSEU|nr:tyrosine-type recombinase/integrase [Kibdelosporangium philippinense]MCE7006408.1 site-specific integrase [Kibdelosporangium philippinense]
MSSIAPTMQAFFTERLTNQRQVSPRTIASYRDSLKLLLRFVQQQTGKPPTTLDWSDLDANLVAAFLDHLESDRRNSPRTRNLRLTAIRSLFAFAALRHPEHAELIQRVLAVPAKRFDKQLIAFLTATEIDALVDAPNTGRWEGRRDRALLLMAVQTGLRVSELIGLNCDDVTFGDGASVRCLGKGRKRRAVPLTTGTQAVLRVWMTERNGRNDQPLFPTRTGRRLSVDAVERLVRLHAAAAGRACPTIRPEQLHPHVLRHSCAMSLLQAGVDTAVIALWLGHADPRSTSIYLHADMTIKQRALDATTPPCAAPGRYQPGDKLLVFLESL